MLDRLLADDGIFWPDISGVAETLGFVLDQLSVRVDLLASLGALEPHYLEDLGHDLVWREENTDIVADGAFEFILRRVTALLPVGEIAEAVPASTL